MRRAGTSSMDASVRTAVREVREMDIRQKHASPIAILLKHHRRAEAPLPTRRRGPHPAGFFRLALGGRGDLNGCRRSAST